MKQTNKSMRGVTLVEIAIVLVIIGLLLGGILKGQELINNARVRSIADQQNALKAAWYSFLDRYNAYPADYRLAQQNIPGAGAAVQAVSGATGLGVGDSLIVEQESAIAMQQLAGAGYIRCPQCTSQRAEVPNDTNSLLNQYNGVLAIFVDGLSAGDGLVAAARGTPAGTYLRAPNVTSHRPRLYIHMGNNIPSNILAEVDRKIDDDRPNTGELRFSDYHATGGAARLPSVEQCIDINKNNNLQDNAPAAAVAGNTTKDWAWRNANVVPAELNCAGVYLL